MTAQRAFLFLLSVIFLSPSMFAQGYRIDVEFKGMSEDTLILGEYFTTRMIPKDTIVLDKNGQGRFEGEQAFGGGLYLIYLDPAHYFDLLLGDDQHLSIQADPSDLLNGVDFSGSRDNLVFKEYKSYLQAKKAELEQLNSHLSSASSLADSAKIRDRQGALNREMEAYMDQIERDYPELFVSDFIAATREPVPPESQLNGDLRHDDSIRFFYYREHYFDHFDPFDLRLLHTPLYEGKVMNYLTRAVSQHPDSLIVAVDYLLGGSKKNEELYRYMLITLFNYFAESKYIGMDAVYFHIAEYYYLPDASCSSAEFLAKLKENLEASKPTLI